MLEKLKNLLFRRWIEKSLTPEVESIRNVIDEIELRLVRVGDDVPSNAEPIRLPIKIRIIERYYPVLYMKRVLWFTKIEKIENNAILRVRCEGQLLANDGRYTTIAIMIPPDFNEVDNFKIDQPVRLVIESKPVYAESSIGLWDIVMKFGNSENVKKGIINELTTVIKKAIKDDIKKQVNIFKGWRLL